MFEIYCRVCHILHYYLLIELLLLNPFVWHVAVAKRKYKLVVTRCNCNSYKNFTPCPVFINDLRP